MREAPQLSRRSLLLGAPRRPLPFDEDLQPKPASYALSNSLRRAPWRRPLWSIKR